MKNDVVVLLPNYNDARGLKKSLSKIEADEEVDILVVDDGSVTDVINELRSKSNLEEREQ